MKNTKLFSTLAMLVMVMLSFSLQAKAANCNKDDLPAQVLKDIAASSGQLDECGFQIPNSSDVKTHSNPMLRPVAIIQPYEYVEYEAAGLIPSPKTKNAVIQGWLVSSCVAIAPRHALIDKGYVDKDLTNIWVDFKVGYQGKGSFKQQVKIKPISCGHTNIDDSPSLNDGDVSSAAGEDFCIYKADRSLKGLVKPIKIGAIDFQRYDVVTTVSVGFFPQASKTLDVLAKDVNAKIVDGDSTYLESRAAVISGAGLIDIDEQTHDKHIIGLQVGAFKVVNSARVLQEMRSLVAKNKSALMCN